MPTVLITGANKRFGCVFFDVLLERGWAGFPLVREPAIAGELKATAWASGEPVLADVPSAEAEPDPQGSAGSHEVSRPPRQQRPEPKKLRRLAQLTAEELERLFEVHCVGAFRCTLAALPFLRRTERPIVVNITE